MKQFIFSKEKWNKDELFYAYNPASVDRATFRQEDDFIVNGKGNSFCGYEMIPLLSKEKCSLGATLETECLFESFGAPLIVVTNDLSKDENGYFVYGKYYEVVAYEEGINIWSVKPAPKGADCPIDATLLATKKFEIKGNTRINIKMQVEKEHIKAWVNGEFLEADALGLPSEFYAGITACEGINKFYSFSIKEKV